MRESGPQHSVCRLPGQRTGSVHPMKKLCSHFLLDPKKITERARGQEGRRGDGGWVRASCAVTQINTNCIKHTKKLQGFCPWSPPRGGALDQSSLRAGACRPRETRALHHRPCPSILTLTTPCPMLLNFVALFLHRHQNLRKLTNGKQ